MRMHKIYPHSEVAKWRIEKYKIRDGPVNSNSQFPFANMRLGQAFWMFSHEWPEHEIISMLAAVRYVNYHNPNAKFEVLKHKRLPNKDNVTFMSNGKISYWYEIVRTR